MLDEDAEALRRLQTEQPDVLEALVAAARSVLGEPAAVSHIRIVRNPSPEAVEQLLDSSLCRTEHPSGDVCTERAGHAGDHRCGSRRWPNWGETER